MSDVSKVVKKIISGYEKRERISMIDLPRQPNKDVIINIIEDLRKVLFPGYFDEKKLKSEFIEYYVGEKIENIKYNLEKQMVYAFRCCENHRDDSEEELTKMAVEKTGKFLETIPKLQEYLDTDVEATFDGDPAAFGYDEIVYSYPGIYAIMVARIAHELYLLEVPLIPRIMTEHAHSLTGIDINPGATIGKYLCIDHGTGIVIGETTIIGEHVKIYQGVTLGGLSTSEGQGLKGKKRHPTICDYVTIYSGASILGGDTTIGKGSVIGGNVFITSSIDENTRVTRKTEELKFAQRKIKGKKNQN